MLRYKDKNGIVSPITKYKDLYIEKVLDYGDKTLGFSADQSVVNKIELEDYIITKTDEYVIKQINDSDNNFYDIVAKLNIDALEGNAIQKFETVEQTALNTVNLALAGTGWTCECDIKKKRTVRMTNSSSWDILKKIADTFRLEMTIDSLNKKIIYKEKIGEDKGCYFSDQLNLVSLSSQTDTTNFYTRILPIGKDGLTIESVNYGSKFLENHTYSAKNKTYIWKDERYTIPESLKEDAAAKLEELACPYISYSCKLIDLDNSCDVGDVITIINKQKHTRIKQRIVKLKHYPDNPADDTCEISNMKLSFSSYVQKYNNTTDTVDNITNDNGTVDGDCIDNIDASKVLNIDTVIANNAEFVNTKTKVLEVEQSMMAAEAKIGTLETTTLKSAEAEITYATIESLKSLSGEFADLKATDFEAIKASVKDLNVDVEKVNTLLFGSATGTTITTDFANSVVSVIGNAQITSAMIKDLAFDKLTGIDINTTVMNVHSEDGKSTWKDNTIQISDKDRVRIQLGKDAAGDYNIYIWDKDGKLMFDPLYGVQEAGIKKAIIRNDMVSDNAAISGKKLDIDSVFSVMNADKSNTFNASKIHVDTTDQTLESTFQTINNYVSGGSEAWGSTMLQAKTFIEHKLWWTDIDEEGNSVKSKFNDVKTTLDSFKIDMSDVTKQLNGTFEIYDITEVPTLDNYPATEFFVKVYPAEDWYPLETDTWQYTQEEYAKHAGAVAYMKSSNRAWKFLKQSSGTYGWTEISSSETAYMLNKHTAFQVAINRITSEVSKVKVDIRDNYSTTESVKSLIQQNTESLTSSISKSYATTTFVNDQVSDTKKYADTAAGNAKTAAEKTAADSLNTAVKNVKDYADSAASVAQTAAEGTAASALSDALKNYTVTKDMNSAISQTADGIKTYVSYNYKRTGGEFNTYIVSEVPTLNNYPATEFFVPVYPAEDWYPLETDTWQYTDAGYVLHIGAIAYNPDTGKTWNFVKKDTGWTWEEISSSETAYMLNSFAKHDVALNSITNELSSVRKDISDNYSTTTEMVNRIVQEIKDDKSTISSSLQATYATQKYADDAANAATSGANNYTDNALKTYSTTADIIQAISPGETSISAAVTAKLGDYATSASLKALIENKDGQLKSAIEAIADTINITAKGGLNLSGNRIAIDSDNFTLTEDGRITKCKNIIVDGGTVGGWKIGDKSIYSSYDYNDVTYDVSLHKAEKPSTHILQVTKEKNNLFDYTFFITAEGKMCSYGQLQESGNTFNSEACLFGGYLKMLDTTNNTYTLIHPHGIHARNKENINTLTLVSNSDDGSGDGLIITGSAGTEVSVLRDSITLWYQPNSQKYTKIGKGYVRICNNNTNYYKDCALSVIGGIKTDSFKLYNQNIGWCGAALNRTSDNDISFGWDGTYLRIYIDNTIIASYKYSPGNSEWV